MTKTGLYDLVNLGIALALLAVAAYVGLVLAPPEREMGDVYRIMYVHVPSAWNALVALTLCFFASIAYLIRPSWKADSLAEASAEVGVFFGALLCTLGAIWARPTWGVYWTWDPRLTTAAIMVVAFMGYLALRRFVDDPERRASWSAVVAILAFADIPIVWYSVKWWRSMHQVQSSPATVDDSMVLALRLSAFAFLALMILFLRVRYRIAMRAREEEAKEPEPAPAPAGGAL
jgi:heme exporter protein C